MSDIEATQLLIQQLGYQPVPTSGYQSNRSGLNVGDQQYTKMANAAPKQTKLLDPNIKPDQINKSGPNIHLRYKNLSPTHKNITQGVIKQMKAQLSGSSSPTYGPRDAFGNLINPHKPFIMPAFKPTGPKGKFARK